MVPIAATPARCPRLFGASGYHQSVQTVPVVFVQEKSGSCWRNMYMFLPAPRRHSSSDSIVSAVCWSGCSSPGSRTEPPSLGAVGGSRNLGENKPRTCIQRQTRCSYFSCSAVAGLVFVYWLAEFTELFKGTGSSFISEIGF